MQFKKPLLGFLMRKSLLCCLLKRFCELIGAGSGLKAAFYALKTFDELFRILSLCEAGNALQIAVAAAYEFNVFNFSVFNVKAYILRAGAVRFICVLHFYPPVLDIIILYVKIFLMARLF